jgi:hypothetical protein
MSGTYDNYRRPILSAEEYDEKILTISARYGLELARQSVASNYIKAEGTVFTAEDDAALAAWVQANPEGKEQWRNKATAAPPPAEGTTDPTPKSKLKPMNHTLRNKMPARAAQAYAIFEGWADPDGQFYCSAKKLSALITGKPDADGKTGQRLLSLHLAAGVIERGKRGRGVRANAYRLVRRIEHGLAMRVYQQHREAAREQMTALGFKRVRGERVPTTGTPCPTTCPS